jgi:hypothetical protein
MFHVINLSRPRKYIQHRIKGKYDDLMLGHKLNPTKIKKTLIIVATVEIIILVTNTVLASGKFDNIQYNYLLDYYINTLHYPKELATKFIDKLTLEDFKELYDRAKNHEVFMNDVSPILDIEVGKKLINVVKFIIGS